MDMTRDLIKKTSGAHQWELPALQVFQKRLLNVTPPVCPTLVQLITGV